MKSPFFSSVKHPGLVMNRYGVVMAERSHPMANTDLWPRDWEHVPIKRDGGSLLIRESVEDEALDHGYTVSYKNGERVYSKPKKASGA